MRAFKRATTTGRSQPAAAATPGHAAPASARAALRSAWWPWPRSPAWAGWPAAGGPRKKPAG